MSQLSVAVVGLGYGRAHIPAFQVHDCAVVAVCQRDQAAATAVAKAYGIPRVFARWEEMLAKTTPDVVVIATPPRLHRQIALAAFAGGAHVVCEKPLAMTRAEAEEMTAAARQAGRIALTGFNWRFPAAMQRFQAMAREGVLGRVFHVNGRWVNSRWANASTPGTWRMDRAEAGHGAMGDQGVHLVDLVQWAFGPIARVSALAGVAYPSRTAPGAAGQADAEDYCTIIGELASGAQITLRVSRVAHGLNEHALDASGADGTLAYRMARDSARWYDGDLRFAAPGAGLVPVPVDGGPAITDKDPSDVIGKATLAPLVANLLRAIQTGAPAAPTFEDGLRAQAVLDAVLESLRQRAWVEVPRA